MLLQVGRYDPRSLMQGDYMQLQYPICQTIEKRLGPGPQPDGVVVLALDKNNIGTFRRLYEEGETLAEDEQLLGYKVRWGRRNRVRVAAESFFFQEGKADDYSRAQFAELRVDAHGHTLLVALRDGDHEVIDGRNK